MRNLAAERIGALQIIVGAGLWGACFLIAKLASAVIAPLVLVWYTSVFAAFGALYLSRRELYELPRIFRKRAIDYIGVAVTGMIVGNLLLYVALARMDLAVCSLLERTQPIFVVLLARLCLNERLSSKAIRYGLIALGGAILLSLREPLSLSFVALDTVGLAAILGTGFSWGLSTIFGKRLADSGASAESISALRFTLAAALLAPLLPLLYPMHSLKLPIDQLWPPLSIALLGLGGFILYYKGLVHVSAGRSAFLELSQPLTGVLLGVAVLGEQLSAVQWAAIPVLLYAVVKLAERE